MNNPEDPEREEPIFIRYGGQVTLVDFVLWPIAGIVSGIAMIPEVPRWLGWSNVALGAFLSFGLLIALSIGFSDERSWVEGGRVQLPLILGSFVASEVLTFASTYYLVSLGSQAAFNEDLSPIGALYFSVATWTTAGFGDIHPLSSTARVLVTLELILAALTVLVVLQR